MNLELEGKKVLVTGALGGFGIGFVRAFQSEGARVTGTGTRSPESVESTLREAFDTAPDYLQMRLTEEDEIERVMDSVQPDIVVSNAGLTHSYTLSELPLQEWQKVIDVNLTGNFLVGRKAARQMKARGAGTIIFISSWAQLVPGFNLGAYSPSKSGLSMLVRALAKEMAPHGIRVNSLLPGIIEAGMAKNQMDREPERRERAKSITPCGRLGSMEEMADAVLWLASPRSGFCFGTELLADGGASLGR